MKRLAIDVWSDVMCPWCLVGWGNLSQAFVMLEGEIEAEIRWHAFELNPDMPASGEERTAHIARKYGRTLDQSREVQRQMRAAAERAGVSLDYEGDEPAPPAMMWNTLAAHKLLAWTGETHGPERQTALKLALFRAHFNARRPIGEAEVLLDVAEETALDRTAAEAALADPRWSEHVRADERMAWDMNVTGVPAMLVERKFMIPGAQSPKVYVDALRRVTERAGMASG